MAASAGPAAPCKPPPHSCHAARGRLCSFIPPLFVTPSSLTQLTPKLGVLALYRTAPSVSQTLIYLNHFVSCHACGPVCACDPPLTTCDKKLTRLPTPPRLPLPPRLRLPACHGAAGATRQLSVTREQLSASEARDKKLTALSRHLLARQQQASQQQASPHAAGAADVAPGTHTAGGGAAALAAPAALSSDRHAPLQTGSLLAAEPGEVPGLPAVRPALAAAADAGSRGDNCTLSEPQSSPTKQLAELLLGDAAPAARGTEIDFGPGSDGEGGRSAAAGGPAENAAPCAVSGGSAAAPAAAVVAAVGSSFEPLATAAAIPAATTGSRDEHAEAESD
eukprot:349877-Chlamydomonas_euryale.AAC.5